MVCRSDAGSVELERTRVLGLGVLSVRVRQGGYWESRRYDRAARLLSRQKVRQVLAPADFGFWEVLVRRGLRPVNPLPLYRAMAAPLVLAGLEGQGVAPGRARVILRGEWVDGELARTAWRLGPLVRELVIDVPRGGERLEWQLYQQLGLAVCTGDRGQGDLRLRFGGVDGGEELSLCADGVRLMGLALSAPGLDLPEKLEPMALLTALWQSGVLSEKDMKVDVSPRLSDTSGANTRSAK